MRALLLALLWCGPLLAQAKEGENAKKGRAHYRLGLAHERSGSYALAAEEFQAAYKLSPLPEYLPHLGDAQRQAGNVTAALEAYKRYLDEEPDGKLADEVARQVAALSKEARPAPPPVAPAPPPAPRQSVYDFGGSARGSYPAGGTSSAPIVHTAPGVIVHTTPTQVAAPTEAPTRVEAPTQVAAPAPREAEPRPEAPGRSRAWLWPTVGVAAGVVVVAVVLGVGLGVGLSSSQFTYGTVEIR